ncbi:MAG TPA: hypothetical protein VM912_20625 [Terriglobales bacterium]|nr:hypothetical protein [Terriglobales bacterium]
MKDWLQETHGTEFELLRHFLLRFFDSDLVTTPGQATPAIIGAISVFLPWFPIMITPLKHKYAYVSSLPSAHAYLRAIRADELWLVTLMMSAIGLLTAIKWRSVFPSLGDYRALAALPLRSYQIFCAKFTALLIAATMAILVLDLFPSFLFPMVSGGRWTMNPSLIARVAAHAIVSAAACYFFFFALVALQGVLLMLLSRRLFEQITGAVQAVLVPAMLVLIVLSFSIQPRVAAKVLEPQIAAWLPPVWFVGLYQRMLGDPDPGMRALAGRAVLALIIAILLSLLTYAVAYQRHRSVLVEGIAISTKKRRWNLHILDWLFPNPRQQAVIAFILKTLAASSQHRMILTAYAGFGLAVLLSGIVGLGAAVGQSKLPAAIFVYAHVVMLAFILVGLRQLFSMPSEWKANWIFQLAETGSREDWFNAIDRLVLGAGAAGILLLPFPLEYKLLGTRAIAEVILFAAVGFVCYESVFRSWEKLPFTCSHLPGKTPMWILALRLYAFLWLLPLPNLILLACIYNPVAYFIVLVALIAIGRHLGITRREYRSQLRLVYEEAREPAVQTLSLLK